LGAINNLIFKTFTNEPILSFLDSDFFEKRMNDPNFDPWGIDEAPNVEVLSIKEESEQNFYLG